MLTDGHAKGRKTKSLYCAMPEAGSTKMLPFFAKKKMRGVKARNNFSAKKKN